MKRNYHVVKRLLLLIITISSITYGYGQSKTVSGKITSSEDGVPIPGVNIIVKNTTTGAVTDVNGQYSIMVDEADILVFASIGYAAQEVPVAGRSVIDYCYPAGAELRSHAFTNIELYYGLPADEAALSPHL